MELYITDVEKPSLAHLRTLVSAERVRRAGEYRFEMDQRRSLCGEALLNHALSLYAPRVARPVVLFRDQYQKPHLAVGKGADAPPIAFSISHSGAYAVCLVARKAAGADIEQCREDQSYERIAARFFRPEEYGRIQNAAQFYQYWTLKECFVKAIGRGLSFPLDEVLVELLPGGGARLFGNGAAYRGKVFLDLPGYVVSVCGDPEEVFPEHLVWVDF